METTKIKNLVGKHNKGTSGLISKTLMLVLILAAFATYMLFARAAPNSDNSANVLIINLRRPIFLFNPFTLETNKIKGSISFLKIDNTFLTRSTTKITQIRIPFKPEVRNIFKPNSF
jgi:hypothetical protein